jgi:hypothetical protein
MQYRSEITAFLHLPGLSAVHSNSVTSNSGWPLRQKLFAPDFGFAEMGVPTAWHPYPHCNSMRARAPAARRPRAILCAKVTYENTYFHKLLPAGVAAGPL